MTTRTRSLARIDTALATILFVTFLGTGLVFAAGFASSVHNAAHDTRHATGFPCH